jgi:transcriptional regulator with XRE-family HTH domain
MQKVANDRGFYALLASPMTTPDAATRVRQRITRLLEDRGHTQRAFAKALGHGDQWASNLLSGRSQLTWDDLDKVAKFLRVPPSEIVRMSEDAWELTPTEMRVVRALRMLPPAVRDHLVTLADYLIGATPDEVELLKRVRQLTPAELRRIEHWIDVTLLAQGSDPTLATHADLRVTTAVRAAPARRNRKRDGS